MADAKTPSPGGSVNRAVDQATQGLDLLRNRIDEMNERIERLEKFIAAQPKTATE